MLLKITIDTNVGSAMNEIFAEKAKRNWFDFQIHIFNRFCVIVNLVTTMSTKGAMI